MNPEHFFELARVFPEPLLLVDEKGKFLCVNQVAANIFGKKCKDLCSQSLFDFTKDNPTKIIHYLQNCATSRAMVIGSLSIRAINGEILLYRCEGAVIQPWSLESTVQILLRLENKDTASNNFVLLNKKIDELNQEVQQRRQAETALNIANQDLENRIAERTHHLKQALLKLQLTQAQLIQQEKMFSLSQMVAGVAHEINNPTNFIHGNLNYVSNYTNDLLKLVELYQEYFPDIPQKIQQHIQEIDLDFLKEDLTKAINSMRLGTERVREIVLSLRNFSRLDEAEFKEVNIHEGLDSALMILQHRLEAKADRFKIEVIKDYSKLPLLKCYTRQLNQAFMNILTNAIDALEESVCQTKFQLKNKPKIWIHTQLTTENNILISIADNGLGIPKNITTKLFDPFFTTKSIGKGTGMGLSISYQIIVGKHGGKLWCDSTLGEGTKFLIEIPVTKTTSQKFSN